MPSGGHNRLSDEEKKARGTFEPRYSQEKLEERRVAKIFSHPRLHEVPKSDIPLGEIGARKFSEFARMLFEAGQLTLITKASAEAAAVAYEQIERRQAESKPVPTTLIAQLNRALAEIKIGDVGRPIAQPASARENKFSRSGFAQRIRQAAATRR